MRIVKSLLPASSPRSLSRVLPVFLLASLFSSLGYAAAPDRITGTLSSAQTVTLRGNVQRRALPQYDQGRVGPGFRLGMMTLLTAPTAAQQEALTQLLVDQQDPNSVNYHQWLTPEQWAERFGLSVGDVSKITTWLKGQGFGTIQVARGRNWITFSGTAAQVQTAFGTEIHRYNIDGEQHVANATAPKVPTALAGVVTGIRGLHDFHLRPWGISRARPSYYSSSLQTQFLSPGDFATIYDADALYTAATPIDGTGLKLAIIGQTDIFVEDLTDFRTAFGLSAITCTSSSTTNLVTACSDTHLQYVLVPGATDPQTPSSGDLEEADLDLEWSGAVARNAQIIYVNAPAVFDNSTGDLISGGVWDAWYYAVDNDLAPVISLSYGNCEFNFPYSVSGSSDETELMKANTEGITFVNSSGDSGAAECDSNTTLTSTGLATQGLSVSYPASSPEVTGVGGTSLALSNITSTYWGTSNGSDGGSVLPNGPQNGYIPEEGWNDDAEIGLFCQQNSTNLFCTQGGTPAQSGWVPITSTATAQDDIGISATGGGPSNCAVQNANLSACVSGFPQPAWQKVSVPSQAAARFSPDVSLLATPNFPGYIFCTQLSELSDAGTGSSCAPGGSAGITDMFNLNNISVIGGTSASAPTFAGIVVLLNQYLGSNGLGNINSTLYKLALTPANGAFHPVTSNSNIVYCSPGTPSVQPAAIRCPSTGANAGFFGFNASNEDSTTGYNLVTGLGSIDVNKLFTAWAPTRVGSSVVLASSATGTVTVNTPVTFTATVTPTAGVGTVSFSTTINSNTTVLGTAVVNVPYPATTTGTASFKTTLPGGTNSVTATYEGDESDKSSVSQAIMVDVLAPNFTLAVAAPGSATVIAGNTSSPDAITITPVNGYSVSTTLSCPTGLPTGATCTFTPNPVPANGTQPVQTVLTIGTLSSMAATTSPAAVTISATGSGVTNTANFSLSVTSTNQSFTLAPQTASYAVTPGQMVNAVIILTGTNGFSTPVTYTCNDGVTESMCTGPTGPTAETTIPFAVTTTAPTTSQRKSFGGGTRLFYAALLPGLLGIMFTAGSRRRSLRGMRLLGLICLLGFSTLWLGSCSGSGGGIKNAGTTAGSYTVTINATTNGANPQTATTKFTVAVN
jgi:hypothetical protein